MMADNAHDTVSDSSVKKVFIVEDHPVFREGLVQMLKGQPGLSVCGEAGSAEQALPAIEQTNPDLALVDITLPGKTGLDLIKEIRRRKRRIKLLVVSMHDEAIYADRVLRAGGDGYIMKQEDPEEIIQAIRDVLNGHTYLSEQVLASRAEGHRDEAAAKARPLQALTDEELQVLEALGQGKSNQEIARQLQTKVRDISKCCLEIRKKLNLNSNNALIHFAIGWLQSPEK